MRRAWLRGAGVIGCSAALVLAPSVDGVAAGPAAQRVKVRCAAKAYNVAYPQLSGRALSVLRCSKPFGVGMQEAKNKTVVVGSTVHVSGVFTNFFDDGTEHGKVRLSGTLGSGPIMVSGRVTVKGGTGAYKHIRGTGKVTCTTTDAGKTYDCKVRGTATF